jgi:hypothetical protein
LAAPLDPRLRDANFSMPDIGGFIIIVVDRHPQSILGESVSAVCDRGREQFPCEGNCAGFEIIPEGEIPRHLKERGMPCGFANLFDIECAHNFLNTRRPGVRGRNFTEKIWLERDHSSIHEKQRRVIQQQ